MPFLELLDPSLPLPLSFSSYTLSKLTEWTHLADHPGSDHPEKAQNIDRHKSDSVEKAKTGKGEWKPELASASEQAITGDKDNLTIQQMQELGAKKSEEGKTPAGRSSSKGAQ